MAMKIFAETSKAKAAKASFMVLGAALALSACTRSTDLNQGGFFPSSSTGQADPLPPAPTARVEGSSLRPASPTPPPVPGGQASTPAVEPVQVAREVPKPALEPVEVARVEPTPQPTTTSSKPVTKQGLVGAWTVSTGGTNCQIFLALTKWSGGFRAASRGCSTPALSNVQAWNVANNKLVLVTGSGTTAATLSRSADERYDGSTNGGGGITFSR